MKTARTGPEHARMFMIQAVRRKKSINNGLKYIYSHRMFNFLMNLNVLFF